MKLTKTQQCHLETILAHLQRRELAEAQEELERFIDLHGTWKGGN